MNELSWSGITREGVDVHMIEAKQNLIKSWDL